MPIFSCRQDPNKQGKKRVIDKNWKKKPGCKNDPILKDVPIEKYCVDELHLMLRVTDRLEDGMFHNILDIDVVIIEAFFSQDFEDLYVTMNKPELTPQEIDEFELKVGKKL